MWTGWDYACYFFIIVSSFFLTAQIVPERGNVLLTIVFWVGGPIGSFWVMVFILYGLKQHIKQIFDRAIIRYAVKTLLLFLLEEITPLGKLFCLKIFSAMFISAAICKLQSAGDGARDGDRAIDVDGDAGINDRRKMIKFLALHCAWATYKSLTNGGLITGGGLKNNKWQNVVAGVLFLVPTMVGIVAVRRWAQWLEGLVHPSDIAAWLFSLRG